MLADRAGLSARYGLVAAGVDNIAASLDGQDRDDSVLGGAFGANWTLDARYPADLLGGARACRQAAEEEALRKGGPPALWKLAEAQSECCRRAAE